LSQHRHVGHIREMPRIRTLATALALGATTHGGPVFADNSPDRGVANWMDAPRTPGDWSYSDRGAFTFADYGTAPDKIVFGMRCDKANHVVSLGRTSASKVAVPMQVKTETVTQLFTAEPQQAGQYHIVSAPLPAADSFLDAMALSKGRFAVEVVGEPTLYIPSWPEVTRVIEDCR
jgi:hypothetical protein